MKFAWLTAIASISRQSRIGGGVKHREFAWAAGIVSMLISVLIWLDSKNLFGFSLKYDPLRLVLIAIGIVTGLIAWYFIEYKG